MNTSLYIRSKRFTDHTLVRILMTRYPTHNTNNDNFVSSLSLIHNGIVLSRCQMSKNIAANPFFSFKIKASQANDTLIVNWQDSSGEHGSQQHTIK